MTVDAATTTTTAPPEPAPASPGAAVPLPRDGDVLPTRRALLGLLVTAGASAAAVPLVGARLGAESAGRTRLDPATALHLGVTGLTVGSDPAAAPAHGAHPAEHDVDADSTDALGARVWSRLVTVGLVVHNSAAAAVLFSPGQVRLRLADGTGVMPVESERPAGALPGLATVRTWVRFLAPLDESGLSVDYTPAGATEPVPLPVTGGATHEHGATG